MKNVTKFRRSIFPIILVSLFVAAVVLLYALDISGTA